jgi:hypothetical protein
MTLDEELAYWKQRSEELRSRRQNSQAQSTIQGKLFIR